MSRERFSNLTSLAAELTNRYEEGFLPNDGGWLNQDHFYVYLIQEGLSAKRERERVEDRKSQIKKRFRKPTRRR